MTLQKASAWVMLALKAGFIYLVASNNLPSAHASTNQKEHESPLKVGVSSEFKEKTRHIVTQKLNQKAHKKNLFETNQDPQKWDHLKHQVRQAIETIDKSNKSIRKYETLLGDETDKLKNRLSNQTHHQNTPAETEEDIQSNIAILKKIIEDKKEIRRSALPTISSPHLKSLINSTDEKLDLLKEVPTTQLLKEHENIRVTKNEGAGTSVIFDQNHKIPMIKNIPTIGKLERIDFKNLTLGEIQTAIVPRSNQKESDLYIIDVPIDQLKTSFEFGKNSKKGPKKQKIHVEINKPIHIRLQGKIVEETYSDVTRQGLRLRVEQKTRKQFQLNRNDPDHPNGKKISVFDKLDPVNITLENQNSLAAKSIQRLAPKVIKTVGRSGVADWWIRRQIEKKINAQLANSGDSLNQVKAIAREQIAAMANSNLRDLTLNPQSHLNRPGFDHKLKSLQDLIEEEHRKDKVDLNILTRRLTELTNAYRDLDDPSEAKKLTQAIEELKELRKRPKKAVLWGDPEKDLEHAFEGAMNQIKSTETEKRPSLTLADALRETDKILAEDQTKKRQIGKLLIPGHSDKALNDFIAEHHLDAGVSLNINQLNQGYEKMNAAGSLKICAPLNTHSTCSIKNPTHDGIHAEFKHPPKIFWDPEAKQHYFDLEGVSAVLHKNASIIHTEFNLTPKGFRLYFKPEVCKSKNPAANAAPQLCFQSALKSYQGHKAIPANFEGENQNKGETDTNNSLINSWKNALTNVLLIPLNKVLTQQGQNISVNPHISRMKIESNEYSIMGGFSMSPLPDLKDREKEGLTAASNPGPLSGREPPRPEGGDRPHLDENLSKKTKPAKY